MRSIICARKHRGKKDWSMVRSLLQVCGGGQRTEKDHFEGIVRYDHSGQELSVFVVLVVFCFLGHTCHVRDLLLGVFSGVTLMVLRGLSGMQEVKPESSMCMTRTLPTVLSPAPVAWKFLTRASVSSALQMDIGAWHKRLKHMLYIWDA